MPSYPVLFLDIDGVLNGTDRSEGHDRDTIRPGCVRAPGHILAEARPKIVLSSSWRYLVYGGTISTLSFEY